MMHTNSGARATRTRGLLALVVVLCSAVTAVAGATSSAQATSTSMFVPAAVPGSTPNTPAGRLAAITRSGVNVSAGDQVTLTGSGEAYGGAGGANPPTGNWYYGPYSGGEFPTITGPAANLYSLIGKIDPAGSDGGQTNTGSWFLVGNSLTFTAAQDGELVFLFHDALYRDNWLPAYTDNSGGFTVQIDVDSASGQPSADSGGPYTDHWEGIPRTLDATVSADLTSVQWTQLPSPATTDPGASCSFEDPNVVDAVITCTDDGIYNLELRASNGTHEIVEETTVTVGNEPPATTAIAWAPGSGCSGSMSVAFRDYGTNDTHTVLFDWADGSASNGAVSETSGAGAATASHTFAGAGSYWVHADVLDDDGGSATASRLITLNNAAGQFQAPINAAGTRSVFKLGSTIPLKLAITACDGAPATGLAPVVNLTRVDSNPDGAVNEGEIAEAATNGKTMQWNGTVYQYNLSTKRSVFNGGADLTPGTYRVSVSDLSLPAPQTVVIDLR